MLLHELVVVDAIKDLECLCAVFQVDSFRVKVVLQPFEFLFIVFRVAEGIIILVD